MPDYFVYNQDTDLIVNCIVADTVQIARAVVRNVYGNRFKVIQRKGLSRAVDLEDFYQNGRRKFVKRIGGAEIDPDATAEE